MAESVVVTDVFERIRVARENLLELADGALTAEDLQIPLVFGQDEEHEEEEFDLEDFEGYDGPEDQREIAEALPPMDHDLTQTLLNITTHNTSLPESKRTTAHIVQGLVIHRSMNYWQSRKVCSVGTAQVRVPENIPVTILKTVAKEIRERVHQLTDHNEQETNVDTLLQKRKLPYCYSEAIDAVSPLKAHIGNNIVDVRITNFEEKGDEFHVTLDRESKKHCQHNSQAVLYETAAFDRLAHKKSISSMKAQSRQGERTEVFHHRKYMLRTSHGGHITSVFACRCGQKACTCAPNKHIFKLRDSKYYTSYAANRTDRRALSHLIKKNETHEIESNFMRGIFIHRGDVMYKPPPLKTLICQQTMFDNESNSAIQTIGERVRRTTALNRMQNRVSRLPPEERKKLTDLVVSGQDIPGYMPQDRDALRLILASEHARQCHICKICSTVVVGPNARVKHEQSVLHKKCYEDLAKTRKLFNARLIMRASHGTGNVGDLFSGPVSTQDGQHALDYLDDLDIDVETLVTDDEDKDPEDFDVS